jgi:uncharacterized membrane protein
MAWIGLVLGALIGGSFFGMRGLASGAAIGIVAGLLLKRFAAPSAGAPSPIDAASTRRLSLLEQRVAALEATLARSGAVPAATTEITAKPAEPSPNLAEPAPESEPVAPAPDVAQPAMHAPVRKGGSGERALEAAASTPAAASAASPLWSWFTNGTTMARIGIVVLFFGIAFLLSYLAEHVTVPIELQFAAVAVAGAALIAGGAWLRKARRAYALALVGGGLGVLYLTTFAALELVPLFSPPRAFTLLAAISTLAVALSLAFDAQALAVLATLGGLLAPVLVEAVTEPSPLFAYVAFVNAVILGVAWFRAWRFLDLVGFVGTFLLSLWWGQEYYEPTYLRLVEPFLIGFFVAYVAVPIAHAWRGAGERRIDAALVFGVPMIGFALQALLVHDVSYGLAWSAGIVAAMYALLWVALRRSNRGEVSTLATAFGALAVIFATLTVPLAVDARWTSAVWAVEAAGVYWIGCREGRRFARVFAVLLQIATGIAFVLGGFDEGAVAFANRRFVGIAAIALSAFASTRFGDRLGDDLPPAERVLRSVLFVWACVWWLGGGLGEAADYVARPAAPHAMLAWTVGSVAVAALLAKHLAWRRLGATAVVLLPALALCIVHDVGHGGTGMTEYGWAVYPLAWALHFAVLHRGEARPEAAKTNTSATALLAAGHAAGALLLVGQIAWEAGEWTARGTPRDTVWAACAHLMPLALYLVAVARVDRARWPLRSFAGAYATSAGTVVAVALALGFVALAILHPGDPSPLPYLPLVNPLEVSLVLALAVLYLWARRDARASPRMLYRGLGIGAFIVLNGIVVRTVHHWLGVPWNLSAILASRPLQAALTLTWTVAALAAMVAATRKKLRVLWFTGAGLLAAVVVKLFAVDLAALSGLTRVIAFRGVGALLLVIGYVAPLPPATKEPASA